MSVAADRRSKGFWPLAAVFGLFVAFLYGPVVTIFVVLLVCYFEAVPPKKA